MFLSRARLLIATLWVGSLWAVGYLVAPTLFMTLSDRVLAGTIAGNLFRAEAWLSICCGVLLLALYKWQADENTARQRRQCLMLICAMLVCTLISHFGLQPMMAVLREQAGPNGISASEGKMQFGVLHGISSALYLLESLMGAALIFKTRVQ